jgi:hypothetical protein
MWHSAWGVSSGKSVDGVEGLAVPSLSSCLGGGGGEWVPAGATLWLMVGARASQDG